MNTIEGCLIEHSNVESQLEMKNSKEVVYINLNEIKISNLNEIE